MERPGRASELMALGDRHLAAEIQLATHGSLGRIDALGPRKTFPMRGTSAQAYAAGRVMLIGEAAHVVPPVGAQGLNMSLRDAAHAAELVIDAVSAGGDPDPGCRARLPGPRADRCHSSSGHHRCHEPFASLRV
jgi:2-octaprenyl-6-methoxyphenol hydroxylase